MVDYKDDGLFICRRKTYLKENGGGYIYEEVMPYREPQPYLQSLCDQITPDNVPGDAWVEGEDTPADGVEGDALQVLHDIEQCTMAGKLYPAAMETIRHALQSTAKLRARVEELHEALIMSDRMLKAWKKAHGTDPHTEVALMTNKSALASLGE